MRTEYRFVDAEGDEIEGRFAQGHHIPVEVVSVMFSMEPMMGPRVISAVPAQEEVMTITLRYKHDE